MDNTNERPVILKEYNPKYIEDFNNEKVKILKVLSDNHIYIEHIGSTSVPDLGGKPLIDIMLGVKSLDNSEKVISLLENKLAYKYDSKKEKVFPNRRYLWKGERLDHKFHIWIVEFKSLDWKKLISIRDILRENKLLRKKYMDIKREAAKKFPNNLKAYRDEKFSKFNILLEKEIEKRDLD